MTAEQSKPSLAEQMESILDLPGEWPRVLDAFDATTDYRASLSAVQARIAEEVGRGACVLPPAAEWFAALTMTQPDDVRVVIVGQDPYPTPGDAMGLSFSVREGQTLPRSLGNIFRELASDVGCPVPCSGDLTPWARQGVLLLNTILTVSARQPKSHHSFGWQGVTEKILNAIALWKRDVIFILWGNEAGSYGDRLEEMGHIVFRSSHPSPMGGSCFKGFYGSKPFTRCNRELTRMGQAPIDWTLAAP